MKNRLIRSIPVLALSLFLSLTLLALGQGGGQRAPGTNPAAQSGSSAATANLVDVNGKKFDPHDFSGIWIRRGGNFTKSSAIPR